MSGVYHIKICKRNHMGNIMTGKERFITALKGGIPDRLPVFDFIDSTRFIERVIGRRPDDYLARDIMDVTLKYGFDGLHPIQRTANMSIKKMREKYGEYPIDVDAVDERMKQCIK
jgi:hypothetical protein